MGKQSIKRIFLSGGPKPNYSPGSRFLFWQRWLVSTSLFYCSLFWESCLQSMETIRFSNYIIMPQQKFFGIQIIFLRKQKVFVLLSGLRWAVQLHLAIFFSPILLCTHLSERNGGHAMPSQQVSGFGSLLIHWLPYTMASTFSSTLLMHFHF